MLPRVLDGLRLCAGPSPELPVRVCAAHLGMLGASTVDGPSTTATGRSMGMSLQDASTGGHPVTIQVRWQPTAADDAPAQAPIGTSVSGEPAVQAMCGLMAVHGREAGQPRRLGLDVTSFGAGVLAAQGALAALIARHRGEAVTHVETSAFAAGMIAISHHLAYATCGDGWMVPADADGAGPPFRTVDGVWVEIEALTTAAWRAFWTGLGVCSPGLDIAGLLFVLRYTVARCTLPTALHDAVARHTLDEVRSVASRCGVAVCPLRTYGEVAGDAEIRCAPWTIRDGGASGSSSAAPRVAGDAHPWHRVGADGIEAPRAATGATRPLSGLRVVEATSRLQGPLAGLLLRQLGATVVHVEPPGGDPGRLAPPRAGTDGAFFVAYNHGKGSVEIDHGTAAGRDALEELAAGADVFLHNWKPGRAERLGLDAERMLARHPSLVWAHASGWGECAPPDVDVGTEYLVQARAGCGEGLNPAGEPPFPTRLTMLDTLGGLLACEAILAGLLHRERTGRGCRVETSLLSAAMGLQSEVLERVAIQGGTGRPVWGLFDRPLRAADGWIMVSASSDDAMAAALDACGVEGCARDAGPGPLAGRLRGETVAEWQARLAARGIGSTRVVTDLAELASSPYTAPAVEHLPGACAVPAAPWSFGA